METLKDRLQDDMKSALKAHDEIRLSTIRMVRAAVRNAEIAAGGELDDEGVLEVLSREAKKRREAIEQYRKGGRQDLVEKESAELAVLEQYLPQQLSSAEIERLAREVITELDATSMKEMGRVMSEIMPRVKGRADGKEVSIIVRRLLTEGEN